MTTTNSSCYPLCAGSCTRSNDATACVGACKDASSVQIISTDGDLVQCGCANGTKLASDSQSECVLDVTCDTLCASCADSDSCLRCPDNSSHMLLSQGKCICAEGYVLFQGLCAQKTNSVADTSRSVGYINLVQAFIWVETW